MDSNSTFNPDAFSQYLRAAVHLESLQNITNHLDKELSDSQNVLNEIRTLITSMPKKTDSPESNNDLRQEHLTDFLAADDPKLIMPDMTENTGDINLDNVIASMKSYTEDLKKKFVSSASKKEFVHRDISTLNLEEYAAKLDLLAKQLSHITVSRQSQSNRNVELEEKLSQLCEEVNNFTKMVEVKSKLSITNSNWTPIQQDDTALCYGDQINKLLLGIHEINYLIKRKD